jgi:hypothetical protein
MPCVREIVKVSASDERPGKGGSGEYGVDLKICGLKRVMSFIKEKLAEPKASAICITSREKRRECQLFL